MSNQNGMKDSRNITPVVYKSLGEGRYAEVRDMGDGSYEVTVENGGTTTIYDHDEAHALAEWWVK
jgi:hypothetical protein